MAVAPIDMLRRLGSGVRPGDLAADPQRFAQIAGDARMVRGRTVQLASSLRGVIDLSDARLEQMSRAADAAESSGARMLLALDDRGAYLVDVAARIIEQARQTPQLETAPAPEALEAENDERSEVAVALDHPCEPPAGLVMGVDAVAVLPADEEAPVDRVFSHAHSLLDQTGMENAGVSPPSRVSNASLALLLAAHPSGSVGEKLGA